MAEQLDYARVRKATGSGDATLLLLRIFHLTDKESGGVVIDGKKYSWRSIAEWAEVIGISEHQAERHLARLAEANLIEKRMELVGKGAARALVLHVRPTSRAIAILKGTPTADLQDPSPQICGTPHHKIAVPPTADLQSPYIEPEDNQKNNQKTTLAGQSPGEPPTASSAENFTEENSNPEKQMKPKIEKGKNSVKDLLKEVHKKKILKPDTSKARVDTLINAMIEWDAAQGKTQIRAPLDGKQIGFLTNFATAMTAMGVLDPLEAITFGVTKWTHVRLAYMGANSDAKPPVNPDVFFLWTMRETVANQLRSSKTPKKQEAVASSVPSTQLTATPPAPPPKKKIATMEEMDAILTKAPAK